MAELSQDQVLAQLRTRGFEEGFQRTPLRDFWGTLTDIGGEMRDGERGAFLVALFNFSDVEVIVTNEPYTSPIAQIEIVASTKARSPMGYWGTSLDKIINPNIDLTIPHGGPGVRNHDSLLGKKLHVRLTPGHVVPRKQGDQWENVAIDCWELIEIAGEGVPAPAPAPAPTPPGPKPGEPPVTPAPAAPVVSATQEALRVLNGLNDQQWHQVVFTNEIVKANNAVVKSIIDKTFLGPMIETGIVTKDKTTGIYSVDLTKV